MKTGYFFGANAFDGQRHRCKVEEQCFAFACGFQIRADDHKENRFEFAHGLVLKYQTVLDQKIQTMLSNSSTQIKNRNDLLSFELNPLPLPARFEYFRPGPYQKSAK